jgi:hypothetical protein
MYPANMHGRIARSHEKQHIGDAPQCFAFEVLSFGNEFINDATRAEHRA